VLIFYIYINHYPKVPSISVFEVRFMVGMDKAFLVLICVVWPGHFAGASGMYTFKGIPCVSPEASYELLDLRQLAILALLQLQHHHIGRPEDVLARKCFRT